MGALIFKDLFNPKSVAIIGNFSNPHCRAFTLIDNLNIPEIENFFKIEFDLEKIKSFKNNVDLLIITVPLKDIPDIIDNLGNIKVKNLIITSGKITIDDDFYEGLIIEKIKRKNIKLLGIHSFGFMCVNKNLNISLFPDLPAKGDIAFISQSGSVIHSIIDITKERGIGFSYIIDLGTLAGIDFGDAIDYLAYQNDVKTILLFVENLKHPRKFLSAVRAVAKVKPVIIVKTGKSEIGKKIIKFSTGKTPGEDIVYDIAFRRAGAVRVNDFTELFICGDILSKKKISYGEKLCIISNAKTLNIFISDILEEKGFKLQDLSQDLKDELKKIIINNHLIINPIDLTMNADNKMIVDTIEKCFFSEEFQTLMVVLLLNRFIDPVFIIKTTKEFMKKYRKCKIIYICIGGTSTERARLKELQTEDILIFFNIEYAVNSYYYSIKYFRSLEKQIAFTPSFDKDILYDKEKTAVYIKSLIEKDKLILSDYESKQILSLYGINVNETYICSNFKEAKEIVGKLGFPVVLKLDEFIKGEKGYKYINNEETLNHFYKKLNEIIKNRKIRTKFNIQKMIFDVDFEFRIGMETDIEFGPYIYLSYKGGFNKVIMLPPLNRFLAQRLIAKLKDFERLKQKNLISLLELEEILVRISHLISNHSEIYRIIIDPVLVSNKKIHIVNAFIELKETKVKAPQHLAIRPYPSEYEFHEKLPDGTEVFIRPIRPEDEPLHIEFFYSLSRQTQYYRFFTYTSQITHEQIAMFTHVDYDREIAIIALIKENGKDKIIGVNRLSYIPYEDKYEFAIVVTDKWQGTGIGRILMEKLIYIAKDRNIKKIYGTVLAENRKMINFVKKFGFKIIGYEGDVVYIMLEL